MSQLLLKYKLNRATKATKEFSLVGKLKLCKVVDVYDGDTCKVVFRHCRKLYRWDIRMNGYDSPEMRLPRDCPNRVVKKQLAIDAQKYLKKLLKEKPLVYIRCGKFDKYGRLLGDIFINKKDKISVNELMVANGYGYKYHGGTKKVNPGVLFSLV